MLKLKNCNGKVYPHRRRENGNTHVLHQERLKSPLPRTITFTSVSVIFTVPHVNCRIHYLRLLLYCERHLPRFCFYSWCGLHGCIGGHRVTCRDGPILKIGENATSQDLTFACSILPMMYQFCLRSANLACHWPKCALCCQAGSCLVVRAFQLSCCVPTVTV